MKRSIVLQGSQNHYGDINLSDILNIYNNFNNYNNSNAFVSGYISTDVNGDNITNPADVLITNNKSLNFIHSITP